MNRKPETALRWYLRTRHQFKTGDLLLIEGRGLIGTAIRVLTGQQFSHVAVLVWLDHGVWVAEMKEGKGYRLTPARQWLQAATRRDYVYWGSAPAMVRNRPDTARREILAHRGARYSYWTLLTVWAAQILRLPLPARLVCSTFAERIWWVCGFRFSQTPDPGDFLHLCQRVEPILETDL